MKSSTVYAVVVVVAIDDNDDVRTPHSSSAPKPQLAVAKGYESICKVLFAKPETHAAFNSPSLKAPLVDDIDENMTPSMVRLLVEDGRCSVHAVDSTGRVALHTAAQVGNVPACLELIRYGYYFSSVEHVVGQRYRSACFVFVTSIAVRVLIGEFPGNVFFVISGWKYLGIRV